MTETTKKPNAGQFKKKTPPVNFEAPTEEQTKPEISPLHEKQSSGIDKSKILQGLTRDLANNKYFLIFEREARPIAEKMIDRGAVALHEVSWFLAHSERVQLAKELKEKYGLN